MLLHNYDYLMLSEAELDLQIGEALYADDFGAKNPSDAEKRRRAQNWFESQISEFRIIICNQSFTQKYINQKNTEERELFDAMVVAFASVTGIPVPVGALAAKIIRLGVSRFCQIEEQAVVIKSQ